MIITKRKGIVETLMQRDDLTREEAMEVVQELQDNLSELLANGEMDEAYNICEQVGLEPDYLDDLI